MKQENRKKLSARIEFMGLTQKEFAVKINCHELTVSRMVTGKTKFIPLDTVFNMMSTLNCKASTILTRRDMLRYQEDLRTK